MESILLVIVLVVIGIMVLKFVLSNPMVLAIIIFFAIIAVGIANFVK